MVAINFDWAAQLLVMKGTVVLPEKGSHMARHASITRVSRELHASRSAPLLHNSPLTLLLYYFMMMMRFIGGSRPLPSVEIYLLRYYKHLLHHGASTVLLLFI